MNYLTYEEFQEIGFGQDITEEEFKQYLPKASAVLDSITRHFYQFNDIEKDVPFRRKKFKQALAAQIEHFDETGATNTAGIQAGYNSVTIGRTSTSTTSGGRQNGSNTDTTDLVSQDVFLILRATGLLYRGVGSL